MKFEFSAGGVVYTKDGTGLKILVSQHSMHHGWVFPKGLIGDSSASSEQVKETKEEAALREVEEETGAKGEIKKAIEPVSYWYVFDGQKIKKTVYYFVMEYIGGDITKHDHEMEAVEWLRDDQVLERLTYKSDKEVFIKALPLIKELSNS